MIHLLRSPATAEQLTEWNEIWNDLEKRTSVAAQAGDWSQKILESSGLLKSPDA